MIRIENLSKAFTHGGHRVEVLTNLNFHLEKSEFVTIVGRSGSGKSTILDLIMKLTKPSTGHIIRSDPHMSMGYVFQKPALFPWRTVLGNVALPLQVAGVPKRDHRDLAKEALRKVGMDYSANRYPFQLSGGMAQRVAIARALVQDPDILLMDEPFSALDPILRDNLNINLLKLWARTRKTILFVTHSIHEAVILSDRIMILEHGGFIKEFVVDLPRPRDFETFRMDKFGDIVQQVRAHLPFQPNMPRAMPEEVET